MSEPTIQQLSEVADTSADSTQPLDGTDQRIANQHAPERSLPLGHSTLHTPHSTLHTPRLTSLLGFTIAVVYLGLAVAISQVTPFNKGPDEGINLNYIEFIIAQGRLPITYDERDQVGPKANWPALYHLGVAGLSRFFKIDVTGPPEIKIFWDSFRYRAIDIEDKDAWYLLTEDQAWPYYGRILVLHLGRWLSILFSVLTLPVVYLITLEFLPNRPWLALTATALLAFIPTFIFVGSVLNEDALVALLAALCFWLLIRVIKQPEKLWLYMAMGLTLGLSVTAKYTTVILPVEVGLVLAVMARQSGYSWRWWSQRLAIVGGSAVLASSWWFGWNLWFLNEVEELGLVAGLLRPLFTGGTDVTLSRLGNFLSGGQIGLTALPEDTKVGTFSEWVSSTSLSFWGVGIGEIIPLSPYAYLVIGLFLAVAIFGLYRLWWVEISSRKWLLLLTFHITLFIILPLIRFGLSRRLGQTAQGRHILIPAAAAVVGLLVWGVATAIPTRWQRWLFPLLIVGLVGWTGAHLYRLDTFAAPLLPWRTLPQAAEWLPHPVKAQFGDPFGGKVELVSYEVDPQPEAGLLNLNLAWRSVAYANQSYLLDVTLLNVQGQIVSHWTGYNGQGRLPTLAWNPGDSVFDRLTLPLPNLPAGDYTVQVQLRGSTGPLAVSQRGGEEANKNDSAQENILSLTSVSLSEPSTLMLPQRLSITTPTSPVEIAFALWRADGPITDLPIDNSQLILPHFRYPATIAVIVSNTRPDHATLNLQLVDASGQAWPATRSEANIYTFVIGPRWQSGGYRLRMTLQRDGQAIGESISEPVLAVENWWQRHFEVPEIASPQAANFADQLKFLGYKLPQNQVKAGEAFPLTLYWQALPERSPQADFVQFNHLLDSTGTLHGGYDRRPLEYYSTLLWSPGEVVIDGYAVPVAADAPPGQYYLSVGYYLTVGESAVNLPLVVDGQMTEVSSITIGPIEVVAP